MQDVFYDYNNKTTLTPKQQENVIKVLILAKKLLAFISTHNFREKLRTEHFFINARAKALFYDLKNHICKDKNEIYIDGKRYRLVMDRVNKKFYIYRKDENTLLVKAGLKGHKIEIVNGLNDQDIQQWEMIGQILQVDFRSSLIHK